MKRLAQLFVSTLFIAATVLSLSSCGKLKHAVSFLYDCETCCDEGTIECPTCEGDKLAKCTLCDGSGERECDVCSGLGRKKCAECGGRGTINVGYFEPIIYICYRCEAGYASCPKTMSCGCVNGIRACGDCDANGFTDCPDCEQ